MCVYVCVCVRFTRACVCVRVVRRTMPWHIIHVGGLVSLTVLFRGTSPMQARRSAAPAAAEKSYVDALILEVQMSEVDSMLAADADARVSIIFAIADQPGLLLRALEPFSRCVCA